MKKDIIFITVMVLLGVFLGIAGVHVLAAIATPNLNRALLTSDEMADFENIMEIFKPDQNHYSIYLAGVLVFLALILWIINLNSNYPKALFKKKTALKAWLIFIVEFILLFVIFAQLRPGVLLNHMMDINVLKGPEGGLARYLFLFILLGVTWVIGGDSGWAGDFESWGFGTRDKKSKVFTTFLAGGVVGLVIAGLLTLLENNFVQYVMLVTEVLDKSGEISFLGFQLLTKYLVFVFAMTLGIIAGTATFLKPNYEKTGLRMIRLIVPVVLTIILVLNIQGKVKTAKEEYHFQKDGFKEILGISKTSSDINKLVVFYEPDDKDKYSEILVEKYPMVTDAYGLMVATQIEVTPNNLAELDKFVKENRHQSYFYYAGLDGLYKGYFKLWDLENAHKKLMMASRELIIPRMMFLARLQNLPVTQGNYKYLEEFSNEEKYHAGSAASLTIAKSYIHFGKLEEARKWYNRAKEMEPDYVKNNEIVIPETAPRSDGKITGRLFYQGEPLTGIKVGLMPNLHRSRYIQDFNLVRYLLAVVTTDENGEFNFTDLTPGLYQISILFEDNDLAMEITQEDLKVEKNPGLVEVPEEAPETEPEIIEIKLDI